MACIMKMADSVKEFYTDQKSRTGGSVFEDHILDVAWRVYYKASNREQGFMVALLHDAMEDNIMSKAQVMEMMSKFFDPNEVESMFSTLMLLTHDKDDSYEEYIDKILQSGDRLAILVKHADMRNNIKRCSNELLNLVNGVWSGNVAKATRSLAKYGRFYDRLTEATNNA